MSELFQLDEAEALDFGLYRVIRRHNREVRAFLGEIVTEGATKQLQGGQLQDQLDQAFAQASEAGRASDSQRLAQLETLLKIKPGMPVDEQEVQLVKAVEFRPDDVDEYRNLKQTLAVSHGGEADRAEVLNRLYQFFSRHYQDGDFIVERRYGKGGARYVKSTGEDTEFHWATEDMYYIKSGDIFTDFPVRLSTGQRLLFTVEPENLKATRDALKPNDKAHYELDAVSKDGDVVQVRLKYSKGSKGVEGKKDAIVAAIEKRCGGDAGDIKRWLNRFIARNQSDFFIHKRLKAALTDDLDIFLKSEVLDADQLLAGGDLTKRAMQVARIVRNVGSHIIDFLAVLEDFQKSLWEKKKLVLEARYVITLDRLARHAQEWLAQNIDHIIEKQRQEWQELGLGDYYSRADCVRVTVGDMATPSTEHYLPLPVDTLHFDAAFKWSMLEAVTANTLLDDALDTVAIHSDNWQALNLLQEKYREKVKCTYIDPPYNTGGDGFPYKDAYKHSSWMAMIGNRLELARNLMPASSAIYVSIDENERDGLTQVLNTVFGERNRAEEIIWGQNTTKNQSPTFSTNHEYIPVYAKSLDAAKADKMMFRESKPGAGDVLEMVEKLEANYPPVAQIERAIADYYKAHSEEFKAELEDAGIEYDSKLDPWKGLFNYKNVEYRAEIQVSKSDSSVIKAWRYVPEEDAKSKGARIWVWREGDPSMPQVKGDSQKEEFRDTKHPMYRFYTPIHPITAIPCSCPKRGWAWPFLPQPTQTTSFSELQADHRIHFGDGKPIKYDKKTEKPIYRVPQAKKFLHEVDTQVAQSVVLDYTDGEKELTDLFGKTRTFPSPKPTTLISRFISQASGEGDWAMDFFPGSGTTWQAVANANRDERVSRKTLLVEAGSHFDNILLNRVKKVAFSTHWKSGSPKDSKGPGVVMRVQRLEQYEDTLENLDTEINQGDSGELAFDDLAFALRYRLNRASHALYCGVEHFSSPFGYQLKRAAGGGEAQSCEVDLVESLVYLLGMDVSRMYREALGVVILGSNRRGQSVAVFFREIPLSPSPSPASGRGENASEQWVKAKLALHPADRVYTNNPAGLGFEGCDRLEAIEAVFATQFGRS
jgi:adenine-specific DNA-methyltransferase